MTLASTLSMRVLYKRTLSKQKAHNTGFKAFGMGYEKECGGGYILDRSLGVLSGGVFRKPKVEIYYFRKSILESLRNEEESMVWSIGKNEEGEEGWKKKTSN